MAKTVSFQEWLNWACKHRGIHTTEKFHKHLFPNLYLNDGTELSVQASAFHLCEPDETLDDGSEYESVEVYTHGKTVEGLDPEWQVSPSTYPRIPIEVMEEICKLHGGIKEGIMNE